MEKSGAMGDGALGFTIIELLVVIIVIGILMTIGTFTASGMLVASRDSERDDDTSSIARKLEEDYTDQVVKVNSVNSPSYPPADQFVNDSKTATGYAQDADLRIFRAPNASTSSMVSATVNDDQHPRGPYSPSLNEYVYQPLTSAGDVCNSSTDFCVSFRLFYLRESDKKIMVLRSLHQQ